MLLRRVEEDPVSVTRVSRRPQRLNARTADSARAIWPDPEQEAAALAATRPVVLRRGLVPAVVDFPWRPFGKSFKTPAGQDLARLDETSGAPSRQ